MKAIHVIKAKGIAGAERHLLDLADGLAARGVDVTAALLVEPNGTGDTLAAELARRGHHATLVVLPRNLAPGAFLRLVKVFRGARPDLVHTHLQHADLYGIPAARLARVRRVVSTQHNDDPRRRGMALRLLNGRLWRSTDAVVAVSESVRRYALEVEKLPASLVRTIHHGLPEPRAIDIEATRARFRERLGIDREAIVIGTAGRLVRAKRVDVLVEAMGKLAGRGLHLVIAGDGLLRNDLRAAAGPRVHFIGWCTEMDDFFASIDLFVSSSEREGFGIVIIEAMQRGLAVVATAVGAVHEIVDHGQTGWLVPPADASALAQAIATLVDDAPLRGRLGTNAREAAARRFGAARMVDRTLALYEELLG